MIEKLFNELQLDIQIGRGKGSGSLLRSKTAKQLSAADVEDRGLTLADTEGMFLLMGIGYLFGVFVLGSEIVGGFTNKCRKLARRVSVATVDSVLPYSSRKSSAHSRWNGTLNEASDNIATDCTSLKSSTSMACSLHRQNGTRRMSLEPRLVEEHHWNGTNGENEKKKHCSSSADLNRYKSGIRFIPTMHLESTPTISLTTAEINRVPTPFVDIDLDETFGEKVMHTTNVDIAWAKNVFV